MFSLPIELILVFATSLVFLIEPVILQLARRLGIMRQTKRLDRLTLLRTIKEASKSKLVPTLSGTADLDREMKGFYESRRSIMPSESLCAQTARAIQCQWPWLQSIHLASADLVDRHLNWLAGDIYLVHEWDLVELTPKLPDSLLASSHVDPLVYRWRPVDGAILLEKLSNMEPSSDPRRRSKSPETRKDSVSSLTGRAAGTEEQRRVQTSGCQMALPDHYHGQRSMLCVKWITPGQLLQLHARSSLLFYYTQMFPKLAVLYFVLLELLHTTGLIEPHRDTWALFSHVAESRLCWSRQSRRSSRSSLSRYALALMLAAYLFEVQRKRKSTYPGQDENENDSERSLLIGFLKAFSFADSSGASQSICVRPAANGDHLGELELVRFSSREQPWMLKVMDPIPCRAESCLSLRSALKITIEAVPGKNESKSIESELKGAEILRAYFGQLLAKLQSEQPEPSLCDLFQTRPSNHIDRTDKLSSRERDPPLPVEITNHLDHADFGAGFWAWVGKRLLVLAAILVAQNLVINYLEDVRTELQDQAHNDLAWMKRSFAYHQSGAAKFPTGETGSRAEGKSDPEPMVGETEVAAYDSANDEDGDDDHDEDDAILDSMAHMLLLSLMADGERTGEEDTELAELLEMLTGGKFGSTQAKRDEAEQPAELDSVDHDDNLDYAEL